MISVIVPTFNSEKFIRDCLRSLVMQDYPAGQYEVIVADNGSTDATVRIVEEFPVTVLKDVAGTVSRLRNEAVRAAKGDILAFIDSDCIAPLTWLSDAVDILEKKAVGVAGCWYALPENPTWVQKIWDMQMSSKREEGFAAWVPSGNCVMRKAVFDESGGFDEGLQTGEDLEMCRRIRDKGYRIYSAPVLAVKHLGEAATVKEFFRKQRWHGIGGVQRFVREFPRFIFDKTMVFAVILLMSVIGLGVSVVLKDPEFFYYCLVAACLIPFGMTVRTMIRGKRCGCAVLLFFLYLVFGLARMSALLDLKLWISELKYKFS